jgi:DNA-binding response OmpR family regulator
MDAKILLVEDDGDLREAMAAALVADGHAVDSTADGQAALDALCTGVHELVLLDVALGDGIDGVEVCRRLRLADTDTYVMMLTARAEEPDVVLALEAGADDYVTKPVGIVELRSRVRAALRRLRRAEEVSRDHDDVLRHEALAIDRAARVATIDGGPLDLTRSEFAVLEDLVRAGGAVRTRSQLTQAIYGDDAYRDPRNVDVHLHHLREKLDRAGGDSQWLATVRGTGYRLAR